MIHRALSDFERRDWSRLTRAENVGAITFKLLLKRFGAFGRINGLACTRAGRTY
jgi:predicted Rossmann fold nucleotide-binding protein DprA/Smf involved in DNA uptake